MTRLIKKDEKGIDYNNLKDLRKSLRQKASISPLFDTENFGHEFSKLLKENDIPSPKS